MRHPQVYAQFLSAGRLNLNWSIFLNSQTSVGSFLVKLGLYVICMVDIERGNAHLLPCAPPSSLHSFPISGYIQPQLVIFLNSQTSGGSFLVILGLWVICIFDIERGNAHLLPCAPPSRLLSVHISG